MLILICHIDLRNPPTAPFIRTWKTFDHKPCSIKFSGSVFKRRTSSAKDKHSDMAKDYPFKTTLVACPAPPHKNTETSSIGQLSPVCQCHSPCYRSMNFKVQKIKIWFISIWLQRWKKNFTVSWSIACFLSFLKSWLLFYSYSLKYTSLLWYMFIPCSRSTS